MYKHALRRKSCICALLKRLLLKLKAVIQEAFLKPPSEFVFFYFKALFVVPGQKYREAALSKLSRVEWENHGTGGEFGTIFKLKHKLFHVHYKELRIWSTSLWPPASGWETKKHHLSLTSHQSEDDHLTMWSCSLSYIIGGKDLTTRSDYYLTAFQNIVYFLKFHQ